MVDNQDNNEFNFIPVLPRNNQPSFAAPAVKSTWFQNVTAEPPEIARPTPMSMSFLQEKKKKKSSRGLVFLGGFILVLVGAGVGAGLALGLGGGSEASDEGSTEVVASPTPFPNSITAPDAEDNVRFFSVN